MDILRFYGSTVDERNMAIAADCLTRGQIIVYPTDTLYALGCDALNPHAIEALCRIKGIDPDKNLLSIVCDDFARAAEYARIDNRAFRIMKAALPGPYTFILPASTKLPKVFKGRKSVGIRIPNNDVARALVRQAERPVLTTSVDTTADFDCTDADSLSLHYDNFADLMLDGGPGTTVPSTIIDLTDSSNPVLVRQGAGEFNF